MMIKRCCFPKNGIKSKKSKVFWRVRENPRIPDESLRNSVSDFWVALYSSPYAARVVHPTLRAVFPNAPKHLRKQQVIGDRLQEVRKLRNRIFHYEPIWHWTQVRSAIPGRAALMTQYEDILLLTGWIGTGQSQVVHFIDCFRQVHDEGWSPLRAKVDEVVLEEEIALEAAQRTV